MIFSGKAIKVEVLPSGCANLVFDLENSSVNKFDRLTLGELHSAIQEISSTDVKGLIFTSAKAGFIVGADITEFTAIFKEPDEAILDWLREVNSLFNTIEDLSIPTVSAIGGVALGGGMELALATDFRVATRVAKVGFPEVKLGIIPGFGGTVRLPRLIGADNANQWISSGSQVDAGQAFKEGALDAVVAAADLLTAAETMIERCLDHGLDNKAVRSRKTSPLALTGVELMVAFETAKSLVTARAGPHYPAPVKAVTVMQEGATLTRDKALELEHRGFVELARGEVAANLVQLFLNEQFLNGKVRKTLPKPQKVSKSAVLGAGIMGGGIAFQSAIKHVPILMKDIARDGIDQGMAEAGKLLAKQVSRGKLSHEEQYAALNRITPTLEYSAFKEIDLLVEAVVENQNIKTSVLAEVEQQVSSDTVIASNTSTISITALAKELQRPEKFCGMHFFNPVPVMPLVEVIRGKLSSDETLATVAGYAKTLGKTPIVVNDCPGFLVNRILFPYFGAFSLLLRDGADFIQVDRVMEDFGWPMGPAYLLDVIGMDTGVHAQAVMAAGFPDRMKLNFQSAMDVMYENNRLGQKNQAGFYRYTADKRGKPRKSVDPQAHKLIATVQPQPREFDDQEINERMMVAMCLETVRCLEDGIVESPIEADMGLILGLGFPAFRGGALRFMDNMGLDQFCLIADKYKALGPLYQATEKLRAMAADHAKFYELMPDSRKEPQ